MVPEYHKQVFLFARKKKKEVGKRESFPSIHCWERREKIGGNKEEKKEKKPILLSPPFSFL